MAFRTKELFITVLPGGDEKEESGCLGRTQICAHPTFENCGCTARATHCVRTHPVPTPCDAASSAARALGPTFSCDDCGAASSQTHRFFAGPTINCGPCGAASSFTNRFAAGPSINCGPCGAASNATHGFAFDCLDTGEGCGAASTKPPLRLISSQQDLQELREELQATVAELDELEESGFGERTDDDDLAALEAKLEAALAEVRAKRGGGQV